MIIFLDESGDLGFDFSKTGTSQKFVVALLICNSSDVQTGFRKAVRRTLKNKLNNKKKNSRIVHELKGTNTSFPIKRYYYRNLPDSGWTLCAVALNKTRVNSNLQTKTGKQKLYNFLARFIIEHVQLRNETVAVTLVVDRSKNKKEIKDFNQYIENQLQAVLPLNVPLNVYHERSHENPGLQAIDLFCWGIFRKYERGDVEWYNLYRDKISFETEYLAGQ